jgi:hypothetical protein
MEMRRFPYFMGQVLADDEAEVSYHMNECRLSRGQHGKQVMNGIQELALVLPAGGQAGRSIGLARSHPFPLGGRIRVPPHAYRCHAVIEKTGTSRCPFSFPIDFR